MAPVLSRSMVAVPQRPARKRSGYPVRSHLLCRTSLNRTPDHELQPSSRVSCEERLTSQVRIIQHRFEEQQHDAVWMQLY
jgi:hypothetical protein